MGLRWLVASLHLVALAVGVAAITLRSRALRDLPAGGSLKRVFAGDNLWAVVALLWLGTGLWRAFGGLEKGSVYYLQHPLFHAKLALFGLVLLLEI